MKTKQPIRQGDVLLVPVSRLPEGCTEVPNDRGRIVLAYGEVTGHAHAIADHIVLAEQLQRHHDERTAHPVAADEITEAAIARAKSKARLWSAPDGARYLEVTEPVNLRHEEHTAHEIPAGVYLLPTQVEYVAPELTRQVAD